MEIEELKKKVEEFDKNQGWDRTEFNQLIKYLQEELDNLKSSEKDKDRVNHLLTEILILIIQISYRYDTDFNSEIKKWFQNER